VGYRAGLVGASENVKSGRSLTKGMDTNPPRPQASVLSGSFEIPLLVPAIQYRRFCRDRGHVPYAA
jgi:hypothetical protein